MVLLLLVRNGWLAKRWAGFGWKSRYKKSPPALGVSGCLALNQNW
jgi:hypothetical protein